MKKGNLKIKLIALAAFLVAAISCALFPFLLADEGEGDSSTGVQAQEESNNTNIDNIINDSNNTDITDYKYRIVEIGSSKTPSGLKKIAEESKDSATNATKSIFKDYIIDANKKVTPTMAAGKVDYVYYYVGAAADQTDSERTSVWYNLDGKEVNEDTVANAVKNADMIYVSNDPSDMYTKEKDITEHVKLALATAATGDYVPFIIDNFVETTEEKEEEEHQSASIVTVGQLVNNNFDKKGKKYATYEYKDSYTSIEELMDLSTSTALFTSVNGANQINNNVWAVTDDTKDSEDKEYVAKVLTIYNGSISSNKTFTGYIKTGAGITSTTSKVKVKVEGNEVSAYKFDKNSSFAKNGYYTLEAIPDYLVFDEVNVNSSAVTLNDIDFSKYDYIVFEKGCAAEQINELNYKKFSAAMVGRVHILYSDSLKNTSSSGSSSSGSTTPVDNKASNYAYILDKVATSTGDSRFGNVLVTSESGMKAYSAAEGSASVYDIARIIIAGSYRGIAGTNSGGDTSNVYTVLEIQPDYPVDLKLAGKLYGIKDLDDNKSTYNGKTWTFLNASARKHGNPQYDINGNTNPNLPTAFYYLRTDGVSNLTADEISYNGTNSLSDMMSDGSIDDYLGTADATVAETIVDYYNWSLSKAKIAHATGRSYDEVNVIHMSSAEFNTSRETLLDSYDAIYIGGDNSAIKNENLWFSKKNGLDYYTMYYHTGDAYKYPSGVKGYIQNGNQIGLLPGNDITQDKEDELREYINNGMPVILDKALSDAYDACGSDHLLDPNSNMKHFLDSANALKTTDGGSVLWYFDNNSTFKTYNDGILYGTTYSGYATVFAGNSNTTDGKTLDYKGNEVVVNSTVNEKQLRDLLTSTKTTVRPRLAVTSLTANSKYVSAYKEGDESTYLTLGKTTGERSVKFNYSIGGNSNNLETKLFIDQNDDGLFTETKPSEKVDSATGSSGTLKFNVPTSSFGGVYWKIETTDINTGAKSSKTGVFRVKRNSNQKKAVIDLLQIMPDVERGSGSAATLYFCTECQLSRGILTANRCGPVGKYTHDNIASLSGAQWNNELSGIASVPDSTNFIVSVIKADNPDYEYEGTSLGVHEHKFGIVKYYDNLEFDGFTGMDDINSNWFDSISDDYDVQETILTTRQYEEMVNTIEALYSDKSAKEAEQMISDYATESAKYQKLYEATRNLINGEYNDESKRDSNYKELVTYLTGLTDSSSGTAKAFFTEADILAYGKASENLDEYLLKNRENIASSLTDKTTPEDARREVDFETNSEIERDKRSYYDLYSLVNSASSGTAADTIYKAYGPLYSKYRDIKILEQYFKNAALGYRLISSVDTNGKKIVCDLDQSFSCIVLGAAENFGNDDIASGAPINALVKYVKEDNDVLLFHDTLTASSGNTSNMTNNLASLFGQNARHYVKDTAGVEKTLADQKLTIKYKPEYQEYTASVDLSSTYGKSTVTIKEEGTAEYKLKSGLENGHTLDLKYGGNIEKKLSEISTGDELVNITITKGNKLFDTTLSRVYQYTYLYYADASYWDRYGRKHNTTVRIYDYGDGTCYAYDSNGFAAITKNNSGVYQYISGGTAYTVDIDGMSLSSETLNVGSDRKSFNIKLYQSDAINAQTNVVNDWSKNNYILSSDIADDSNIVNVTLLKKDNAYINSYGNTTASVTQTRDTDLSKSFRDVKVNLSYKEYSYYPAGFGSDKPFDGTQLYAVINNNYSDPIKLSYKTEYNNTYIDFANYKETYSEPSISAEGTLPDGFGEQTFTIKFVDNDGNPISGESVEYVLNSSQQYAGSNSPYIKSNGKTNIDGCVEFSMENSTYNKSVTGITASIVKDGSVSKEIDNQQVTFKFVDPNGNILKDTSFTVSSNNAANADKSLKTGSNGEIVVNDYKNYTEKTVSARYTLENDYAGKSETYYYNKNGGNYTVNPTSLNIKNIPEYQSGGAAMDFNSNLGGSMFKYSHYDYEYAELNVQVLLQEHDVREELRQSGKGGATDKATQTNVGFVTLYPFNIGSRLQISPTSMQCYTADIEDRDLIVYYALAGGSAGSASSVFAADPNNGAENYFLYRYGNVTYTGAGHGCVTGYGRNNNDERRLFINIILSSAHSVVEESELNLYDETSTINNLTNRKVIKDPTGVNDYVIKVTTNNDTPVFSFLPTLDSSEGVELTSIQIFYDLDNNGEYGTGDVEIFNEERQAGLVDSGVLTKINADTIKDFNSLYEGRLQLQANYFIDGYAYIVVIMKDSTGMEYKKTIRIELPEELQYLN